MQSVLWEKVVSYNYIIKTKYERGFMKNIVNYTEKELQEKYEHVPYDKLHICYEYFHKSRLLSVDAFCRQHYIGKSTLYRYLNLLK